LSFKDHFSALAAGYAVYRPDYPQALFDYLAAVSPRRECAWDCATGSGQAALALAGDFQRVIATDASAEQIAKAYPHPRVHYAVAAAEDSALPGCSVDLVTVAQALHWFDLPRFFTEVERVLRPDGVLAVWTYNLFRTGIPELDAAIRRLYGDVLDGYWPPERRLVERGYQDLSVPFMSLAVPTFEMHSRWDATHLLGYLHTWSAVRNYRESCGTDPVAALEAEIRATAGARPLEIRWPLAVRAFRR
jgi:SAM-dependent methyltransferase